MLYDDGSSWTVRYVYQAGQVAFYELSSFDAQESRSLAGSTTSTATSPERLTKEHTVVPNGASLTLR